MFVFSIMDTTLPLTNPVLKFLLILVIILFAPIILNRIKIPHLLGLIIAGALIGPNGFNLIERDSGIILSGTAGLLYIMFLAGLEIDLADFKKNSRKSLVFGLYTFSVPMVLGTFTGIYVLEFSIETSVLLASMFASHTLIAYPLISKLGVGKNSAVNITVGGTIITDTLALLVLAVIVGMAKGEVNTEFWVRLTIAIVLFTGTVTLLFPIIARWFFKHFEDNVSQYIFVLVMVFLGATLAELAGIEAIIGAFLSGLSLNRLVPHTSPLMNRIEFVGNAIFIPFFLLGVGMLVDYRVFLEGLETIKVATIMIIVATSSKFIAAWLTQKTYKLSLDQRRLIFGLSNAQAAATLAAVLVGYAIIIGESQTGEPIRLLNENVLNGTILMILVTCTIASFVAQKGAKNIVLLDANETGTEATGDHEKILIPVSNIETTEELINLGISLKSRKSQCALYALSIVDNHTVNGSMEKKAKRVLEKAAIAAAATDHLLHGLLRYDINLVNGIISVVMEHKITDLILGLHVKQGKYDSYLGSLTEGILLKCNTTTLIYKAAQPFTTVRKNLVIVPAKAEKEIGFPLWLVKIWNLSRNSGTKMIFYGTEETLDFIKGIQLKYPIECHFKLFEHWDDFSPVSSDLEKNDNLIVIMSRKEGTSYQRGMDKIPSYLEHLGNENSFILVYPVQTVVSGSSKVDFKNPTIPETLEKIDELGRVIAKLFKTK